MLSSTMLQLAVPPGLAQRLVAIGIIDVSSQQLSRRQELVIRVNAGIGYLDVCVFVLCAIYIYIYVL